MLMAQSNLKIVQARDSVNFNCIVPIGLRTTIAWVKQTVGVQPLLIASSYQALAVMFENDFDKHNHFFVAKDDETFHLRITNARESDTATYYCVKYMYQFIFGEATDLIVKGSSDNAEVMAQNYLKIVQAGDSVNFTCNFERDVRSSAVWVRQRVGGKPLTIVSSYQALDVRFENDFDKHNRFFATKDDDGFNLSITNTEESDTATYYCVKYFFTFTFGDGIDLVVKDAQQNMQSDHETAVIDPEYPEDSALALQCSVLTQSCAGEHNVYWFRHESGESPPVIIFTQEHRNTQCERSSDVNHTERKCIYTLPKRNFSHSDAGIYSCAVAACGEILFGDARKPDLPGPETPWSTIALILATSNCLSVIVIIILGAQLYKHQQKGATPYIVLNKSKADVTTTVSYTMFHKRLKHIDDSWNKAGNGHFNLTILKTKPSDSAAYYCVVSSHYSIGMGAGTRLLVKDAAMDRHTSLQQTLIDTFHPGDSVSLQCSIFSESCTGEHSVYWFRQSSEESQGVLYTKGERNGGTFGSNIG
ncbi:fibroblast growth factor receptor 4-like protein [Labeo rohita]|uniref:Fibroblast growth factor receptor 4-like protein n=1 Tax=Labeo rohita TaxID=84645 RepID=A0A498NYN4_LABRO|nr:fibroblast growth factor receptor 4-like protein [Labeo rohita]